MNKQIMDNDQIEERKRIWEGLISIPIQVSGALFALDIVFLQNLVQGNLNTWQTIALILFAVALPCIGVNAFISLEMRLWKVVLPGKSKLFFAFQIIGYYASIAGVAASIMAASLWIGVLFIIATFIAGVFCVQFLNELKKQRQKHNIPEPL